MNYLYRNERNLNLFIRRLFCLLLSKKMQSPVLHTRFSAEIWRHWYHLTDLVHLFTTFPYTPSKLLSQNQIFFYASLRKWRKRALSWALPWKTFSNRTVNTVSNACKQHKHKKQKQDNWETPQRKTVLPRQTGKLFLEAPFFSVRCSSFCRSPRGSEQKQSLKQRICWELGYIAAAGSSRLLRRM